MKTIRTVLEFVTIALIISSPCHALEWAMTYGGSDPTQLNRDEPGSIQQTSDGGYIVAGTKCYGCSEEATTLWVLKLDPYGNVTWEKTYPGSSDGWGYAIQQTSDGGYVVTGDTGFSARVLKLHADGSVDWHRTYNSEGYVSIIHSIQETCNQNGNPDGYIVAGSGEPGEYWWIMKLNPDGTIDWEKRYGGNRFESAYTIQQTFDQNGTPDGYIVAGHTYSFNAESEDDPWIENAWVMRLDVNGNVGLAYPGTWQKTYGTTNWEEANSVQQTFDVQGIPSGYIVAGTILPADSGMDQMWVLKLDTNGGIEWQKAYTGIGPAHGSAIQQTGDGHYVVAGYAWVSENTWDIWVLKLHSNGTVSWHKTFDKSLAFDLAMTQDGGYVVIGRTYYFGTNSWDFLVLKLDEDGEIPGCGYLRQGSVVISNSQAVDVDTSAASPVISTMDNLEAVTPQDTSAATSLVCSSAPDIWVTPVSHDFGDVALGTPSTVAVEIHNTGEDDLAVSDISFDSGSSGDYVLTSAPLLPHVLSPWESVGIEVTFTPSLLGTTEATLEITSDDPYEGLVEVALSGNGVSVPVANFVVDKDSGTAPVTIQFTDQSTGSIDTWEWDFDNDGTIDSTDQSPAPWTYTAAGDYTVTLTVTGPGGSNTETKTDYIHVTAQSICSCNLVPDDIPTVIPRGGTLGFQASITNNTGGAGTVLFGTKLTKPDTSQTGFIWGPLQVYLNPYQTKSGHKTHSIPVGFELGIYTYHGYVGRYGNTYDECQFDFEVVP